MAKCGDCESMLTCTNDRRNYTCSHEKTKRTRMALKWIVLCRRDELQLPRMKAVSAQRQRRALRDGETNTYDQNSAMITRETSVYD